MSSSSLHLAELIRVVHPGYRIVFTNGCFDLIHPGHIRVLRACRQLAGYEGVVVVGLNSDESIRRLKGPSRPILDQASREEVLLGMGCVNYVAVFDEDTPYRLIKELRPHFIVKGGDYKPYEVVGQDLADVHIVPLQDGWSTSAIIDRIFLTEWERRRESFAGASDD